MTRLMTKVFDTWAGLFMQKTGRGTKKEEGSRVAVDLVRGRERCRHASVCRELDTELLAQEKSVKRKEEAHIFFVRVCVWIALLVVLSLSRCCGIDRRSFVQMFSGRWGMMIVRKEVGFPRRRQRVLCGKMSLMVLPLRFGDERDAIEVWT